MKLRKIFQVVRSSIFIGSFVVWSWSIRGKVVIDSLKYQSLKFEMNQIEKPTFPKYVLLRCRNIGRRE